MPPVTKGFADEPAFDEAYGLCGIAAVGVGAKANLQEAGERRVIFDCYEVNGGEGAAHAGVQECVDFEAMFFQRRIGPEEGAHLRDFIAVGDARLASLDHLVKRIRTIW
jgi:hypothetical protein